ncbi:hypothetical protein AVEN_183714-1 [Araneus ventricosus]|uniref:Carbamoyl phosphate synthase ATP-binding domain-containing protein n=1 Tax=Araneus ventricosus TaxID=182803 RepID=A0A4Y2ML69_ARAVE|nr:hypothetical protein AVEN_183714-1 [Araneus ventricosus]
MKQSDLFCYKRVVLKASSVMLWGCLAANGIGNLQFCTGAIKAPDYIRVLEVNLRSSVQRLFGRKRNLFQQNNARPHTTKITKTWLRTKRVPISGWLTTSPDLSPIANIWRILKRNNSPVSSPPYTTVTRLSAAGMEKTLYRHIEPFSVVHD